MTIDKERLRVLAEAATPGPWILLPIEDGSPYLRIRGARLGARYKVANVLAPTYFMPRDGIESTANAEFIAAARDAVPALLSENAALAAVAEAERVTRIAAQCEADDLKERLARSGVEQRRAVRTERAACAVMCDAQAETHELLSNTQAVKGCDDCATAIRARGRNVAAMAEKGGVHGPLIGCASPPTAQAEGWTKPHRTVTYVCPVCCASLERKG